jgi:hypothetical protein
MCGWLFSGESSDPQPNQRWELGEFGPLIEGVVAHRPHRWNRLLEAGQFASMADLAAAEGINHSYVRRILRLTLLSPEIIQLILDGQQSRGMQLETLLKPFPVEWERHMEWLN